MARLYCCGPAGGLLRATGMRSVAMDHKIQLERRGARALNLRGPTVSQGDAGADLVARAESGSPWNAGWSPTSSHSDVVDSTRHGKRSPDPSTTLRTVKGDGLATRFTSVSVMRSSVHRKRYRAMMFR
jgi:hypothetical protein